MSTPGATPGATLATYSVGWSVFSIVVSSVASEMRKVKFIGGSHADSLRSSSWFLTDATVEHELSDGRRP